uniref:Uncharacterized protein n=1 Tax=Haemonchus contortus TaxID=6289 RepID=A0A7I4Y5B5_HAECO
MRLLCKNLVLLHRLVPQGDRRKGAIQHRKHWKVMHPLPGRLPKAQVQIQEKKLLVLRPRQRTIAEDLIPANDGHRIRGAIWLNGLYRSGAKSKKVEPESARVSENRPLITYS